MDWSQTRAYAIGLAGMFINQEGREAQGIVEPGAATKQLVQELVSRLTGLKDPERDEVATQVQPAGGNYYSFPTEAELQVFRQRGWKLYDAAEISAFAQRYLGAHL